MLLFFVVFIFIILHIQGLARFVFFGTSETTYYYFTTSYLYNRSIAIQSLILACACACGFAAGYKVFYRRKRIPTVGLVGEVDLQPYRTVLALLTITGIVQVVTMVILAVITRLDYVAIIVFKYDHPFPFQSRVFFLVILAYILLNIPPKQLWTRRDLRLVRWIVFAYSVLTVLLQARSEVFEIAAIVLFSLLMWNGDKVKVKYVLLVVCSLIGPNLIVLGRLGFPTDPVILMKGLFSFEYSTLFNNILSEAVLRGREVSGGFTFLPQMTLLIPSPIRAIFGISAAESDYFAAVTAGADVLGGGFSFVAEMFSNFGWFAPLVFAALGALIGRMNAGAARVGKVSMIYATAPLLYEYFILVFRNDFAVFLKSAIQIFIIALLIDFLRRLRLVRKRKRPPQLGQVSVAGLAP